MAAKKGSKKSKGARKAGRKGTKKGAGKGRGRRGAGLRRTRAFEDLQSWIARLCLLTPCGTVPPALAVGRRLYPASALALVACRVCR